jgi:hypothetical protein
MARRRLRVRLTCFAVVLLALPSTAGAASLRGARYLLRDRSGLGAVGVLQVSDDGRSLASTGVPFSPVMFDNYGGSYFSPQPECEGSEWGDVDFFLGAPLYVSAPITPAHTFTTVVRFSEPGYASAWARLGGRFVGDTAIVTVTDGVFTVASDGTQCPMAHTRFGFHRRTMPPFGSCMAAKGRTVIATRRSRIYKNWGVDERGRDTYAYGCLRHGRQIALGRSSGDNTYGTLNRFHLAGPYVSSVDDVHVEFDFDVETLAVVDLRGFGRAVRSEDAIPPVKRNTFGDHFARTVLTPRGSSAWVASYCRNEHCRGGRFREVWIADRKGTRRVDHSRKIDPSSLALHGRRISWRTGGVLHSAPIR